MKDKNTLIDMLQNKGIGRRNFIKGMGCLGLGLTMGLSLTGCEETEELRDPYPPLMSLTDDEMAMLNGDDGLTLQKIMETVVRYGDIFGADRLVPIDGPIHVVGSFGMLYLKPYFSVLDELTAKGLTVNGPFTADPRPPRAGDFKALGLRDSLIDLKAPVFRVMYKDQKALEDNFRALGMTDPDGFTCTCYMEEVGNTPSRGQVLSWAESSAVSYANSVIGARTNRNSALIEIFGGILGKVPNFGLLRDENRKASWKIQVKTSQLPEAQVLGSAMGMKVFEDNPYIAGLSRFLGTELNDTVKSYLKDMGAAAASNGAVGLYHVENLTPEAVDHGQDLLKPGYRTFVIDDTVIKETIASYPVPGPWEKGVTTPEMCFIGCPHLSLSQLHEWTESILDGLRDAGKATLKIPTVLTTSPHVLKAFKRTTAFPALMKTGAQVLSICPLMYMGNPMLKDPILTNSNKLRTYSDAKYATGADVLNAIITGVI